VRHLARHTVPDEVFRALAAGGGGAEAVALLQAAQRSKRLLLLRGVRDLAARIGGDDARRIREAYDLIAAVERADPEAWAVLGYPTIASSALRAAMDLSGGAPDLRACADRLAAIAAAAAVRVAFPATVELPAAGGRVVLPSLGVATGAGDGRVVVRSGPGGASVGAVRLPATPDQDGPGWTALPRLTAEHQGVRIDVALDERDPDRMPGAALARRPLTDEEFACWRATLGSAWTLLVGRHRAVAEEIRSLITALTPLTAPVAGEASATSKEAVGNVGVSTPRDVRGLAVTLAHEVQHVKLTALIDIVALTLPDDGGRYYAPWREDPRPLAGLLQGVYAHLGVVGFWRAERAAGDDDAGHAHVEFARWRAATARTIATLRASGRLTEAGEAFVAGMDGTLREWCAEPVPADAEARAAAAADRHLARWRERTRDEAVVAP
jgi:HEXXH motif-containing protein